MKCPKCGIEQADAEQCVSCGIYVAKYEAYLAQKSIGRPASARDIERKGPGMLGIVLAGAVVMIGLGWMALGRHKGNADEAPAPTPIASNDAATKKSPDASIAGSLRARLDASHPPKNEIERARNATVFIQTEWGASGSGFIVDSDCRVVTNRHVIEFNEAKRRSDVASSREIQGAYVEQKRDLLIEVERLSIEYQKALRSNASSADLLKLREEINRRKAEFDGLADTYRSEIDNKIHDEAWKFKYSHLKVSLVDGTEYSVANVTISERFDLAEFTLNDNDCPFLVAGNLDDLAQGSPLFTIGNPSGLTYTVTSGVFSGFREDGERIYLQTDAPINAGNSGGPLIDPQGRVVGINTMVLKDAQNIGFSIPVTAIDEAF